MPVPRSQTAQHIGGVFLDVFVVHLHYLGLVGFACETHAHHSKTFFEVLDDIDIQDLGEWDSQVRELVF